MTSDVYNIHVYMYIMNKSLHFFFRNGWKYAQHTTSTLMFFVTNVYFGIGQIYEKTTHNEIVQKKMLFASN